MKKRLPYAIINSVSTLYVSKGVCVPMNIETVTKKAYDIVVVGGGIGGVSAAVAAARSGADVLLIEKSINLGGLATRGLISWYEPLCDGKGHRMIGGIGEELIRLAVSVGLNDLPDEWSDGGEHVPNPQKRYCSHFSPTFFSLALDRWVLQAGVDLVLDSYATYPEMEGHICRGVLTEQASGRAFYPAKVVIDATGDASIACRAGIPCELGDNFLSYWVHDFTYDTACNYVSDDRLAQFRHWNCVGSAANGNGHPDGMRLFHGDSAEEITEFLLKGKALLLERYSGTDPMKREIMTLPEMPQLRTIRHIVGKEMFDGTENGMDCKEPIGVIGDFRRSGRHYAIPFGTLYHPDFPNLLTAGRIIGATGDGWEITRVIPGCAMTGEAAGYTAYLALSHGNRVDGVPYSALRTALEKNRVILDITGK